MSVDIIHFTTQLTIYSSKLDSILIKPLIFSFHSQKLFKIRVLNIKLKQVRIPLNKTLNKRS